jgi:hypothetical protein
MSGCEEDKEMDRQQSFVSAETAEFCARELEKSRKMQLVAGKDKTKTRTLLAELSAEERELCEARKLEISQEVSQTVAIEAD